MASNPLRVIICSFHYYPDHPNGADRLAFDEALFLASQGHEVWLIAQDITRSKPEYSFRDNIHVLHYPSPRLSSVNPQRIRVHQKCTEDILRRYLKTGADVLHGHSLLNYDGALSLFGRDVRSCFSMHSPVYLETRATNRGVGSWRLLQSFISARLLHRIEHRCLLQSDTITTFSSYTRALIQELHGAQVAERTSIIPGWVDLDRFQVVSDREEIKKRLGWPLDVPVLFTLRRLVPRMGLDRLLCALQSVRAAGWRFNMVIGGEGPLRAQLENMVHRFGLSDCVSFAGFVPEKLLPLMYAAADVFVLPTAELECFGIIALESLSCGRPVLATPIGAIPEIIQQVEPRWLTRDTSSEAIAERLVDFLGGDLPQVAPERLRALVHQNYSRDSMIARLVTTAMDGLVPGGR